MRIQGYFDRYGKIVLAQAPSGFKAGTSVWVEIPDDALQQTNDTPEYTESEPVLSARARNMVEELQEIRATSLRRTSKTELTEKEQDRWEAFELRAKMREEQGRAE